MTDPQLCEAYRDSMDLKIKNLEMKIEGNRAIFDERVRTNDRALSLAQKILDERMEKENQIREELRKQTETFLTRIEYTTQHQNLIEKIEMLSREASKLDGRMVAIVFLIPIILSTIMGIVFHLLSR